MFSNLLKIIVVLAVTFVYAQNHCSKHETRYFLSFTDKPGAPHNLIEHEDFPVHAPYLHALAQQNIPPKNISRWFNGVTVCLDSTQYAKARTFSFIKHIAPIAPLIRTAPILAPTHLLPKTSQSHTNPLKTMWDDYFQATQSLPGTGMRVAVIDAGFFFQHVSLQWLLDSNKIIDQWNFVTDSSDMAKDPHGSDVLSIIAGNPKSDFAGLAPFATFMLYVTEDIQSEYPAEADNIVAAMERAALHGAQVVNISLGYRYDFTDGTPDFPTSTMDGTTHLASKALKLAARRGILVVVASGNEHSPALPSDTSTITVPSDADSILSVGAVNNSGLLCSFSSRGLTADDRTKPDLVAPGCPVYVASTLTLDLGAPTYGTSFAAPQIAGFAAALWSAYPQADAMTIRQLLLNCAEFSHSPQPGYGYGRLLGADCLRQLQDLTTTSLPEKVMEFSPTQRPHVDSLPIPGIRSFYLIDGRKVQLPAK
jgi:serine protease AprX